jgi:1-deoxy-D-xylulose 5-phosphate reductoisomerase
LQEKITFSDIFSVVEAIFYHEHFYPLHSVEDVIESIEQTKHKTHEYVTKNIISRSNKMEKRDDSVI